MKKRILSAVIAVMLTINLLPATAGAADGTDDITVEVNPGMGWNEVEEENTAPPAGAWGSAGNYDTSWYTNDPGAMVFTITTAEQLAGISVLVKDGTQFSGKTIELGNDINLQAEGTSVLDADGTLNTEDSLKIWTPIGDASRGFLGTFDGQGRTISGLYIPYCDATQDWTLFGLFGRTSGATIKDVKLEDVYLYGKTSEDSSALYIGGIVASGYQTTIDNCSVSGRVVIDASPCEESLNLTGSSISFCCGGVAGYFSGGENKVSDCTFSGNLLGWSLYMGGIVGYVAYQAKNTTITKCTNNGIVANQYYLPTRTSGFLNNNHGFTGGIAGRIAEATVSVTECINNGQVTGMRGCIGGIAGFGKGKFQNCANKATVNHQAYSGEKHYSGYIGGIVGLLDSAYVDGCTNNGTVAGEQYFAYVGGVIGSAEGYISSSGQGNHMIENCANHGAVAGCREQRRDYFCASGGIAGSVSVLYTVKHCINTGMVISEMDGSEFTGSGGIVGTSSADVQECYNSGTVIGYKSAGGIVGSSIGHTSPKMIESCYNTGTVISTKVNGAAGGLIGYMSLYNANYTGYVLRNCYNAGGVSVASGSYCGGAVGYMAADGGTVTDVYYWDGTGGSNAYGTAKTVWEMTGDTAWTDVFSGFETADGSAVWAKKANGEVLYLPHLTAFENCGEEFGHLEYSDTLTDPQTYPYLIGEQPGDISLDGAVVSVAEGPYTYNGAPHTPGVTVTLAGETLVRDTDYTVSYRDNIGAGMATVTITGMGDYAGEATGTFTIAPKPLTDGNVILSETVCTYDGNAKTPAFTVDGATLAEGTDCTVTYANNINAGAAAATITGRGNYTGTVTKSFTINKAAAPEIAWPTAGSITYGQRLSESVLFGGSTEYGAFAWTDGSAILSAGDQTAGVGFTPGAGTVQNYETIAETSKDVSVTVEQAAPAVSVSVGSITGSGDIRTVTLTATLTKSGEGAYPTGTVTFRQGGQDIGTAAVIDGKAAYTWTQAVKDTAYSVTAEYGGDTNYTPAASAALSVDTSRLPQTVAIAETGGKTYGDEPFTLSLSDSGSGTGAVTFTSSDEDILSISGATAVIHKAGTVTITARKAADDTYDEAEAAVRLTVAKKALTITAEDKAAYAGNALPVLTYTMSGLVNGDPLIAEPTLTCGADMTAAGTYVITAANADAGTNYEISYIRGTLTVTDKPIPNVAISADPVSLIGSGTVTLTVSGVPAGGSVTVACSDQRISLAEKDGVWTAVLPNATSAYTFTAVYPGSWEYAAAAASCTVSVIRRSTGGSSGGSALYDVETSDGTGRGTVTASHTRAGTGTTVTITVIPDEGYALDTLTVTDARGGELKLTGKGGGKYTFRMPNSEVTVKAAFTTTGSGHDCPALAFTDLSAAAWYHGAVDYALTNSLMSGYADGTFRPNAYLSRAMLAQILYNLEGRPAVSGGSVFTDVPDTMWCAGAVRWAAANGVVTGYADGTFRPAVSINREQLAVMLYRYAVYRGMEAVTLEEHLTGFADSGSISGYAAQAMNWAVGRGVMDGYADGTLKPQGSATRAVAAQMLKNFLESIGG
ncbi:MAG: S-layer homology domain-containing protein [Oscillospiraceae bacterium]|nr:S-layer homology domain-containing protein [Oscillospiraceae bacterium]